MKKITLVCLTTCFVLCISALAEFPDYESGGDYETPFTDLTYEQRNTKTFYETTGDGSTDYEEYFEIFVYRMNGDIYMKITPVAYGPFICSTEFYIIQDSVQYDDIKIEKENGDSQCGDLFVTSKFRLSQYSFANDRPNFAEEFSLRYDGGDNFMAGLYNRYTVDAGEYTAGGNSGGDDGGSSGGGGGGGCFIVNLLGG